MFVQNHHSFEELQRLTKALTKKRIWLRHRAVVLAKQGHSAPAIAGLGMLSPCRSGLGRPLQPGGPSGPQERPHPDARPAWPRRMCRGSVTASRPGPPRGWRLYLPLPGLAPHPGGGIRRQLARQAIYDLLHRLDYSSLMPRPQHEQANPEVQEFFKEIVVEQIDAIAAAHPEKEIHTYFQDEARFGQKGTITRVWGGGVRDRVRCGRRDSARSTCWRPSGRHGGDVGGDHAHAEHRGRQPVLGAVRASCPPGCMQC